MVLAACPRAPHQPGALEHLHVLRDGVERHVEGLDEVGYARGALRQPLDDLSARRVRERREGEGENRGRHIFNLRVEYSNRPALVKRSEVTLGATILLGAVLTCSAWYAVAATDPTSRKALQCERHEGVFTSRRSNGRGRSPVGSLRVAARDKRRGSAPVSIHAIGVARYRRGPDCKEIR